MNVKKMNSNGHTKAADPFPDPAALGRIIANVSLKALPLIQRAVALQIKNLPDTPFDPLGAAQAWGEYWHSLMEDPKKLAGLQSAYMKSWMSLMENSAARARGETVEALFSPARGDKRFQDKAWEANPYFDFLKQTYVMTANWLQSSVDHAEDLDPQMRARLDFITRQYADALSPTNFWLTNPDVLKETVNTNGENLIRGLENFIEDLERGGGQLKISMTDYKAFHLGKNIACTPGKVIARNEIMELIQYEPATDKVFKTPLLIIPPWINKYYILDLKPENSFVKWLTEQGHTVFMISWVNPGPDLGHLRFEDYMQSGILDAITEIENATGEKSVNTIAYCIGGTLLAMTLAYLKDKKQDKKIKSATFLTTLLDFENAGELKLFTSDEQIELLEKTMGQSGILDGRQLAQTFAMLRANDLIWSFVVNNYMMGREPFSFDLLYWNDDSTNLPASMHGFYLKNMYRDNKLIEKGGTKLDGVSIDLSAIKTPSYFLSARDDHIAPWRATFEGPHLFGGPCEFVLSGSGHIAGVINPPHKNKYCYWTNKNTDTAAQAWMDNAQEHAGSWWPHWQDWIRKPAGEQVNAHSTGTGFCAAPGTYVKKML